MRSKRWRMRCSSVISCVWARPGGGALADRAQEVDQLVGRAPARRAACRSAAARAAGRPRAAGSTTHQRMPVAAIVAASAALVVMRSIRSSVSSETCGWPSLERGAGGGTWRVGARAQRGEPARVLLGPVDPARRSAPGSRSASITSTAHASASSGDEQVDEPLHALPRPRALGGAGDGVRAARTRARVSRAIRAGPRTPGVAKVIESSVPPPGGSRRSTSAASRPIVGSPSPSPGESARGCIPRPSSVTMTVSSSAPVDAPARGPCRARGR